MLHLFSLARNKTHRLNAEFVCTFWAISAAFERRLPAYRFFLFFLSCFTLLFFISIAHHQCFPLLMAKCVCVCLGISCCCCCEHVDVPQFCSFLHREWLCVGLAIFGVAAAALFIGNLVWAAVPELALSLSAEFAAQIPHVRSPD